MEPEPTNNYEAKRQERERAREEKYKDAQVRQVKKSLLRYGVWAGVVALMVFGVFFLMRATGPQGEDHSTAYDIQGREHIANGATHPPYNSNPPSSGWHYASPARTDFYAEPIPDESAIHNIEHGDIWIAYRPTIPDEAKSVLKKFAGAYVLVSPRAENAGDISLVAWGRVDTFDIAGGVVDEGRITDFIHRYDNRGPEKVRGIQAGRGGM